MANIRKIEFTGQAPVIINDDCYNPFQRDSYNARVEYDDDYVVFNVLPKFATCEPPQTYLATLVEKSDQAHALGVQANIWED